MLAKHELQQNAFCFFHGKFSIEVQKFEGFQAL